MRSERIEPELLRTSREKRSRMWIVRLVMPLLILVIAGVLILSTRQDETVRAAEIHAAVENLCAEIVSSQPDGPLPPTARRMQAGIAVVSQLHAILADQQDLSNVDVTVSQGDDVPPYGDGAATHVVTISVEGRGRILLRVIHRGSVHEMLIIGYRVLD